MIPIETITRQLSKESMATIALVAANAAARKVAERGLLDRVSDAVCLTGQGIGSAGQDGR